MVPTKCVNTILNLLEIIPQLGMSDKDKCQCGKPTCITAKGYYKSGHGGVGTFILHKFEGKR